MRRYSAGLAMLFLVVVAGSATPSHAQAPGYVSVVFAKAGLIVGAAAMRLTGRVSGLRELKDFSGTYDAVGAGGALVGGFGGVQLTNQKGVTIMLQGVEAGLEFAANRSGIRISLQ
jgi:hypothetical protein